MTTRTTIVHGAHPTGAWHIHGAEHEQWRRAMTDELWEDLISLMCFAASALLSPEPIPCRCPLRAGSEKCRRCRAEEVLRRRGALPEGGA